MKERDYDLYQKVLTGDKHALEKIYDKYEKLLYSFAYKTCGQKEMSEEVMQEVFIKIWTQKATYDETKGKFSSWIITIARYTAIDVLRKKENQNYALDEEWDAPNEKEPSVEDLVEWKERGSMIREAMKHLPKEQKKIVMLFYFKGLTQQRIAEHLDISLGTVKSRIRLALKRLKKELAIIEEKGGVSDA
ncbi:MULTISPECIES: RNA polymerase sigma factor [Pontibacillus]|uniref:DNA-directed RNA polymerase sigma-70 factor n=1 Tax=Pontibacillus salipaludis TaxID=1697394 RepID=A0ABQ1QE22_9BACI|nr:MULTISPECIES: sigma-70 family RNA polymerase sigma factor [Pontibacillus]QST01331.1 sigma-70 family RNA polymerase sigma factor [Pontibacillus sp. ALD_SL1]GGD24341.1 DNA-directed RNA polymerase sigma-70 factor [Pontibacillus salipaludis]